MLASSKTKGKEKEEICILIVFKSHYYKVTFIIFYRSFNISECWSLAMQTIDVLTTCL